VVNLTLAAEEEKKAVACLPHMNAGL